MYSLIRPLLFKLDPETAHHFSLAGLRTLEKCGLTGLFSAQVADNPISVKGFDFKNPVGLAAGLDKNGDYIDALASLGFGAIEIGTITPRPQPGNPQPRMFRLPEHTAIINRMGFNNDGVDVLVANVKKAKFKGTLGINIGKNKDTPNENAVDDYLLCMEKVYEHASYITVNLSSPNTPGLRDLQFGEPLRQLLQQLKAKQKTLAEEFGKHVPLAIKVAPDMSDEDIADVAQSLLDFEIEGLIATNTTIGREAVAGHKYANEAGGLSGAPVSDISTQTIKKFAELLKGRVALIGVGGITDTATAAAKREAGADMVQIYSGFIYKGSQLIEEAAAAY